MSAQRPRIPHALTPYQASRVLRHLGWHEDHWSDPFAIDFQEAERALRDAMANRFYEDSGTRVPPDMIDLMYAYREIIGDPDAREED